MIKSLEHRAYEILIERDCGAIVSQTIALQAGFEAGEFQLVHCVPVRIEALGRPDKPILVAPRELKRRSLGSKEGRAALLHAIAHIEFNAIHLALDAVYRFSGMPREYYSDWLRVAAEEAKHFTMLSEHLNTLGYQYGDFPAHNGLWQMAVDTDDDVMIRMALVPRLLEARGLDVGPQMAKSLKKAGDSTAAEIMDIIIREEIGHVAIGNRWFHWCCDERKLDPMDVFKTALEARAKAILRGPLCHSLRLSAGFTQEELDWLEFAILKQ